MDVINLRSRSEIHPANFDRTLSAVSELVMLHAEVVKESNLEVVFKNNTPDLIKAQSFVTANDSTFTLIKEDALENVTDMIATKTDEPDFEARVAKTESAFKSSMTVVYDKTVITSKGLRRGFTTNGNNIIHANFGPNKFDTASTYKPTG